MGNAFGFSGRRMIYGAYLLKKKWTDARLKAFIISALRAGSRRYPPKFETLNEAKTEKKINTLSGRLAQHYKCAKCKEEFPASLVQVDHKNPVVDPKTGFVSWDVYIKRMFCEKKNLQVLCKECHAIKTKKEKQISNAHK
jgi:5-methylcytosine-specific restriction endonuclease McrA